MEANRNTARYAGLFYWLACLGAPFAYLYVPSVLLAKNDALATTDRVLASEGLLRAAIFGELFSATLMMFAALTLYGLFRPVDRKTAAIMVAMMLASVPISYANSLFNIAPLLLLRTPAIAALLGAEPAAAHVTLFLHLHNYGVFVGQILAGLWLFPIGMLILRSGFIPRWLAYPLFFAGTGYVCNSLGQLFLPPSLRWMTASLQILGLGEMPFFSFYLLIWGVRGYRVDRVSALLALMCFAIAIGGLILLMIERIEPIVYGAFVLGSVVALFGAALRWRTDGETTPTQRVAGT